MSMAWAQSTGAPAAGRPTDLLFLMASVFAIFYFLVIRPEQKRKKDHDALLSGLKRNDRITLSSGIHGRVMALSEKTISVEIAPKVHVEVDRSAIQQVHTDSAGTKA
jgi:preprotein translocase subunit YajC